MASTTYNLQILLSWYPALSVLTTKTTDIIVIKSILCLCSDLMDLSDMDISHSREEWTR